MFARTVSLLATALGCASVTARPNVAPEPAKLEPATLPEAAAARPALAADTVRPVPASVVEPNAVGAPVVTAEDVATGEYRTPLLDEPSLARAARAACEAAEASGRPLLLEFSAAWCEDCLVLERLKTAPPLARELQRWELFVINVGGGFEHPALMRVFRVDAIAKLVAVEPRSCAEPPTTWRQGPARTLDGLAKHEQRAGAELAAWLGENRTRSERAGSAH
jgi:hypothetical protein